MEKVCKRCGKTLDISRFYQHPQMKDGHLNICMGCVKERVRKHRIQNIDAIRAYDRIRGRKPENVGRRREYANKKRQKDPEAYRQYQLEIQKKYRKRYREKGIARLVTARALRSGVIVRPTTCGGCGVECKPEAHHTDYSKPLDVIWLCDACHKKEHRLSVKAYALKYHRTEA